MTKVEEKSFMKNKTKYLITTFIMVLSFMLVGFTNVNAETTTVDVEDSSALITAMNDEAIDIVRLNKNIELSSEYDTIFYIYKSKTLDLNGHTITVPDVRNIRFWYYENVDIKIMNSSNSSSAKIIGNHTGAATYYLLYGVMLGNTEKVNFEIDGVDFEVKNSNFVTVVNMEGNKKYENLIIKNSNIIGNQYLFWMNTAKKVYLESITLNCAEGAGRNQYRQISNEYNLTINDVIDANAVIEYYPESGVKKTADRTAKLNTTDLNAYWGPITVKFANGFNVSNASLIGKYGETPEANITIKNIGENDLQIKNVTVSDTEKFAIMGGTQPTITAGATNTDFKVKAKAGLDVGDYTATITVEAMDGKTYTATVTLKVEKKNLTVGISGLDSTWVYGTTKTPPTATGVDGLGADDYKITYSKENNGSYEDMGKTLPKLVGKYKATLSIINPNYTASDASKDFEITQINTEVKVTSNDATFTYDGNEHSNNDYTVSFNGVTGNTLSTSDTVNAVVTGKVRDFSDTADGNNTIESVTIKNADGVDVTSCYSNIVTAAGKLTVNPITTPIVVTAGSDTKVYDGTDLTKDTYTYTDGVLLAGDTLEATITGSQKFVGTSNNTVSNVKVVRNGKDITSNYTMGTHVDGTLTVNEATQTFTVNENVNVLVNGSLAIEQIKAQLGSNIADYKIEFVSGTAGSFDSTTGFTAGSTGGKVEMKAIAPAKDENNDGTNEYAEAIQTFYINVINKENVTISGLTDNQEFTYDGTSKKPSGTITVDGDKVPVDELEVKYEGTGSTTYNSATAPTNVGTYKVTYKVPEDNTSYVGTYSVEFSIKKAGLDKVTLVKDTFEYTGTDITPTLNNVNDKIEISGITTAKNVSNNTITAKIKDISNYEWKDATTTDLVLNWSITQATPEYTVPTGLTGVKGETLNDVTLPDRFTWNDTTVVLTAGTNTYKATYTPVDTTNYKTITDIDIEVNVKDKFNVITSVNGGNGTITPSIIGVIEGTKEEITFTPNSGYVVSKVMVNEVEKTSEVENNKIEITVTEEMTVEVTYKRKYTGGGGGSTTTTKYKITVTEGKNGSITPNGVVKVEKGEDQTFKIKAEKGYEIADVLVDGKSVGAVAKYTFENVKAKHTIEATFKKVEMPEQKPEEKETFKDVKKNDWYYEAVEYVANKGLMNGTGNDEFTPNANTTRGMIVTILYRLEGSPEVSMSTFTDVANTEYYAKAVAWAEKNGIVNGYGEGKFGPNDVITREQLAAIMYRYSNYKKYNTSVGEDTNILSYNDISELSEYAVSSMQWACGAGLVNGIGDGKLAPKGNATRAQLATILMRYCESNK